MARANVLLVAASSIVGAAGLAAGTLAIAAEPAAGGAPPSLPPFERMDTMTLERVEPHVMRVLDDGAGHDLTSFDTFEDRKPASLLAAGDDGSVWMTSSGGFIRIGTPGEVPDPLDTFLAQMEVGPDGTLWIADRQPYGDAIGRWHDGAWTIHQLPRNAWVVWLDATPDGSLDFAWRDAATLTFGTWSTSDEAVAVKSSPPPLTLGSPDGTVTVARTPDGRTWVAEGLSWMKESRSSYARFEPGPLWTFDGQAWQRIEPLGDLPVQPRTLAVDESGRLQASWVEVVPGTTEIGPGYLTRLDEAGSWTVLEDGRWIDIPETVGGLTGSPPSWCEGYTRSPEREMARYLDGVCLRPAAITPNGAVWVFGHDRQRQDAGVYVILPELGTEE